MSIILSRTSCTWRVMTLIVDAGLGALRYIQEALAGANAIEESAIIGMKHSRKGGAFFKKDL